MLEVVEVLGIGIIGGVIGSGIIHIIWWMYL
jgi:hypothetical protein